jgi:hypothetical protein
MERLIEIFRRFSMAIIWSAGIIISAIIVIGGYNSNDDLVIGFGVGCIIFTWILARLINWVFGN